MAAATGKPGPPPVEAGNGRGFAGSARARRSLSGAPEEATMIAKHAKGYGFFVEGRAGGRGLGGTPVEGAS